jgi:hypothetical protein
MVEMSSNPFLKGMGFCFRELINEEGFGACFFGYLNLIVLHNNNICLGRSNAPVWLDGIHGNSSEK